MFKSLKQKMYHQPINTHNLIFNILLKIIKNSFCSNFKC